MSFCLKPLYFEKDGPVCTRSASSFCRNPLNFCTHVIWVKWWYHAKFQPFLSSFVDAFHFQGHLTQNKSLNAWKIANEVRKGSNFTMWFRMLHIECTKILEFKKVYKSEIPLEEMSFHLKPSHFERDGPVCTWNASSFFVTSQILHTCYVGQMMIPCQVSTFSEFICNPF